MDCPGCVDTSLKIKITLFTSKPWLSRDKYVVVEGCDCALMVVTSLAARKAKLAIKPATYRFIILSHEPRMSDAEQSAPSSNAELTRIAQHIKAAYMGLALVQPSASSVRPT